MNDENQLPKDIWDEIDPIEELKRPVSAIPQPTKTNLPNTTTPNTAVETVYAPNTEQAQILSNTVSPTQKHSANKVGWWAGGLVILVLAGWYGWVTIYDNPVTNPDTETVVQQDEIEWQTKTRTTNLRLLADPADRRVLGTKYWKVGSFVDGKYADSDLVVMETISSTSPSSNRVIYRFVLKNGEITLLAKESPDSFVEDGLDVDAFSIDNDYAIPQLHAPDKLKVAYHPEQELILQKSNLLVWFDEKQDLAVATTDPEWGEIYKESATLNIPIVPEGYAGLDASAPTGALYLQLPDGTIHTYQLKVPFISASGVADVVWSDGSRNKNQYESYQRTVCGVFQNYTAIMPDLLASELQEVGKVEISGHEEPIWELIDKNHRLLTDAYELARKDSTQPPTSYEQFLASYPIVFWKDGLGRLVKLQNTSSLPASGCYQI